MKGYDLLWTTYLTELVQDLEIFTPTDEANFISRLNITLTNLEDTQSDMYVQPNIQYKPDQEYFRVGQNNRVNILILVAHVPGNEFWVAVLVEIACADQLGHGLVAQLDNIIGRF